MDFKEISIDAFQVIGVKTRTSNSDEMSGAGKIPNLWSAFYSQQVLSQIPFKIDQDIVAVYYDYESNANGPYSLIIGAKVVLGTKAPDGMEVLSVPRQKYAHFTTRVGEMPAIILETWQNIWELTEKLELKRGYSFDLEVYGKNATHPAAAQAELLISLI